MTDAPDTPGTPTYGRWAWVAAAGLLMPGFALVEALSVKPGLPGQASGIPAVLMISLAPAVFLWVTGAGSIGEPVRRFALTLSLRTAVVAYVALLCGLLPRGIIAPLAGMPLLVPAGVTALGLPPARRGRPSAVLPGVAAALACVLAQAGDVPLPGTAPVMGWAFLAIAVLPAATAVVLGLCTPRDTGPDPAGGAGRRAGAVAAIVVGAVFGGFWLWLWISLHPPIPPVHRIALSPAVAAADRTATAGTRGALDALGPADPWMRPAGTVVDDECSTTDESAAIFAAPRYSPVECRRDVTLVAGFGRDPGAALAALDRTLAHQGWTPRGTTMSQMYANERKAASASPDPGAGTAGPGPAVPSPGAWSVRLADYARDGLRLSVTADASPVVPVTDPVGGPLEPGDAGPTRTVREAGGGTAAGLVRDAYRRYPYVVLFHVTVTYYTAPTASPAPAPVRREPPYGGHPCYSGSGTCS